MTIFGILCAVLIFSFLIFIHELGHFAAAKLFKVQVNEFAMFMGPAIFKKKVGETLYSLRCIPIGGYCAMEGEDQDTDSPHSFQKAAWWKRLIILVAGSFMNLLVGFLLVLLINSSLSAPATTQIQSFEPYSVMTGQNYMQPGDVVEKIDGWNVFTTTDFSMILSYGEGPRQITVNRNGQHLTLNDCPADPFLVVAALTEEVPAEAVNNPDWIQPRDMILSINETPIHSVEEFYALARTDAAQLSVTVMRDGKTISFPDYPAERFAHIGAVQMLFGINFTREEDTFLNKFVYSVHNCLSIVQSVPFSLMALFTGKAALTEVGGPVMIVQTMTDVARQSGAIGPAIMNMLYIGGIIALNLAVMNMLPIPALDGGRCVSLVLTTAIERIIGKKLNPKVEGYIHAVGMIVLLILMAVIMLKDIVFIFMR